MYVCKYVWIYCGEGVGRGALQDGGLVGLSDYIAGRQGVWTVELLKSAGNESAMNLPPSLQRKSRK